MKTKAVTSYVKKIDSHNIIVLHKIKTSVQDETIAQWYRDGIIHRDGGPAMITSKGAKIWYRNGKFHREDGPAVIVGDAAEWYLDGIRYYEKEFNEEMKRRTQT